jgi:hypothetical protein
MHRLAERFVVSVLALCVWCSNPTSAQAQPEQATIGLYLTSLNSLNMGAGTFAADFWLWSTTRSTRFAPLDTLDIVNEVQKEQEPVGTARFDDIRWDQRRVRVTARSDWNVAHFPFDHQRLEIQFEDSYASADELAYQADRANSGIHPAIHVPGWRLVGWNLRASEYVYPTNFGHPQKSAPTRASRVTFAIDIQRDGWTDFLQLTLGAFVAFAILALTFRMNPTLPPIFAGRMGVIVASVFTVTISLRGVNAALALPIGSTLVDKIHLITLGAGFAAAVAAATARYFAETNREAVALQLDRRLMPFFVGVYLIVAVLLTMPALLN